MLLFAIVWLSSAVGNLHLKYVQLRATYDTANINCFNKDYSVVIKPARSIKKKKKRNNNTVFEKNWALEDID